MSTKRWMILILSVIVVMGGFILTAAYFASSMRGSASLESGKIVLNLTGQNQNEQTFHLGDNGYIMPGDSGKLTIGLDASGSTADVYATMEFLKEGLPNNLKFYYDEDYKYQFTKYFSVIEKSNLVDEVDIYWYWDGSIDDDNDSLFIGTDISVSIDASIVQLQSAYMKNGSSTSEAIWNSAYKNNIESVTFKTTTVGMPDECTADNLCFDITADGTSIKVYAYLVEDGTNYDAYIVSNAMIFAPSDSSYLLSFGSNLKSINFNSSFITSDATNMTGMFASNSSLNAIDLSVIDTKNVTNMNNMFDGCTSLAVIDCSTMDVRNVDEISYMFNGCNNLSAINVSNFSFNLLETSMDIFNGVGSNLSSNTVIKVNSKSDAKFVLTENSNWSYGNVYMHYPNDCLNN